MSFGFGLSDFLGLIRQANTARKAFLGAPKEYASIAEELKSFTTVLQEVDDLLELHDMAPLQEERLCEIIVKCKTLLDDLDKALKKYSSLETTSTEPQSITRRSKRIWQQIRFDAKEFHDFRDRITTSTATLNAFMSSIISGEVLHLVSRQKRQEAQRNLDWIADADYAIQQHNNISQYIEGTGQWLLESTGYLRWLNTAGEAIFLQGIPGAGKSILSSIVVKHLQKRCEEDADVGLCYIYCDFRRQQRQTFDAILLTILRQLMEAMPARAPLHTKDLIDKYCANRTKPESDKSRMMINEIAKSLGRLYIVVDALDECQTSNGCQKRLIEQILSLREIVNANIFVTSRPVPLISKEFEGCISMEIRATDNDIQRYVDFNMERLLPMAITSELQGEIRTCITESADGMFLLAKLNLNSLLGKTTKKKLRAALAILAQRKGDYSEAYDKTMTVVCSQSQDEKDLALEVLSWVVFALQPLKAPQLVHALAVEEGERELDEDNIPDLHKIISVTHGLIEIESKTGAVRLIHYTTQEFFTGKGAHWLDPSKMRLAGKCLAYLTLAEFDSGKCLRKEEYEHRCQRFPFHKYASRYWGNHARVHADPAKVYDFLSNQQHIDASLRPLKYWSYFWLMDLKRWTALHLIAYFGLAEFLQSTRFDSSLDSNDIQRRTPLMVATFKNHESCVRCLLEKGAQVDMRDMLGRTALSEASRLGYEAIVRLLLDRGAALDTPSRAGITALMHAAKHDRTDICRLLLERGAQRNLVSDEGKTAQMYALGKACEVVFDETI